MQLLTGTDKDGVGRFVSDWTEKMYGQNITAPFAVQLWMENDKPLDYVVYNWYTGSSIEIHVYTTKGLTRRLIRGIYNYTIEYLHCNVVIAKPARKTTKLTKILPKAGFKYLATIPMFYGKEKDDDAIMFYITQDNAHRWK